MKAINQHCNKDEYKAARNDKNISFVKIAYFSDSLKVIAYYIKPVNNSKKKFPVVVFNRGSLMINDIGISDWNDGRLSNNEQIIKAWFMETNKDRYLKQSGEILNQMGYLKR